MSCEQRLSLDYIPNTPATIGVTLDGITDTLDLTDAIHNVESKTHMKLNKVTGNIEFWNELYMQTNDEGYLETIGVPDLLEFGNLEDLGNVHDSVPKAGDILYYKADADCGPNCVGIHDAWVKLRAPKEDGVYKLTMTVSNGKPTLSWEKEEEPEEEPEEPSEEEGEEE